MTIATGEQILASDLAGLHSKLALPFWGTIAEIPTGWLICDGNNGTPNLLGKFLEGVATAATNPGTTGGATSKNLDIGGAEAYSSEEASGTKFVSAAGGASLSLASPTAGTGFYREYSKISDIRPLFYDVAFITKA
jgi:hypothetical protein